MNMDILEQLVSKGVISQSIIDDLKDRKCPFCHRVVKLDEFSDVFSVKEFTISGLCQKCQSDIFGV